MVRLTDRPDMTLDVYRGRKTTMQQQQQQQVNETKSPQYIFLFSKKKKKKKKMHAIFCIQGHIIHTRKNPILL